ncbi:MAG: AMP-binding protein [Gammaproteobacteria bacterium]|nr:AMP-binding protein [Gammaproteobacteria bacterium]
MELAPYPEWEFNTPEFLNIGYACTSKHLGTDKENEIAMIIEDSDLGSSEITYKELAEQSDQFVNFLDSIDVQVRDRVLICLKNSLAYPIAFFGCIKRGAIAVPTSTLLSGSEVKYLAMDSQAKALVLSLASYSGLLPYIETMDNLQHVIVAGIDSVEDLPKPNGVTVHSLVEILAETDKIPNHYESKSGEPAYLVYTSGTTGFPKGVLHSHRSLIGREPASQYWFSFEGQERIMHSGKFNWTYVLGSALMDPLYHGHTVVAYEGKNSPDVWVNLIKQHKCTIFIGVPTIYRQIIQKTEFTLDDCPSLRHCMSAGEHLSSEMITAWQERFRQDIYEAIGMSEFSYYISHSKFRPIRPGSAGFVQPGHRVQILDPETLEEVGPEEEGMICISEDDPGLFLEYWQLEEETRKARRNGYFFTGDFAKRDKDGYIWFLGRRDDIINTFGYRVSPHEIERVMKTHPLVADCVAFGLDVAVGKTIVAIAIMAHGEVSAEQEEEILVYGQNNLARYKCPKQLYVMDEYPKTKNGKVLRKTLVKDIHELEAQKETLKPEIYRARRSMLYTSARSIKHINRARTVLADAIIFDVEEMVQEEKETARQNLIDAFNEDSSFGYSERVLRVNALGTAELEKDMQMARNLAIDAILFPFIETAEQVVEAGKMIQALEKDLEFMISIQTPLGVLKADEICAACPTLKVIVIGTNTLANRMQINIKKSTNMISGYLSRIALAARAYDKIVIDGPFYNVGDEFSCEASTKMAYGLGFDGKALIHPVQIEYINDIFTPKREEVEHSLGLLDVYEKALQKGKTAILYEGELIDIHQAKWAQRMITLYDKYKELGQDNFI